MRVIRLIVKRNIVRTFRNKGAVLIVALMSLLPAIMLLGLGEIWMIPMVSYIVEDTDLAWEILRANILAITLSISAFTAPVSILGLVSEDFENKTIHNFLTAPIKRKYISFSYIISGVIFGFIFSVIIIVIGQTLLLLSGDGFLGVYTIVKLLLFSILVLTSLSTIFFYIMSGVRKAQTAGAITGMIGGFAPILGGVYIQLSLFPSSIGTFLNFLPFSHTLAVFKRLAISPEINNFGLAKEVEETLYDSLSINLEMFGEAVSPIISIVIIFACILIFGGLSVLRFSNFKK